jgi:hypothetical protein
MTVYNTASTELHVSLKWAVEEQYTVNGHVAGQTPQ